MSKEQIEELAKTICDICRQKTDCSNGQICTMAYIEAEGLYKADYRKQSEGEWLSTYDYAVKLGETDPKMLADAKEDKRWKFCSRCEQQVKWYYNYCPNCGARMRGGAE